ncbi:MAG TPA: formylglycine-generating enzyme family protein [Planctomycetaceae bacterium]
MKSVQNLLPRIGVAALCATSFTLAAFGCLATTDSESGGHRDHIARSENEQVETAPALPTGIVPFDAATARKLQQSWAKHLSVDETVKNSIGMQLILIPPGKNRLLNEVEVTLVDAFYLGKTEVTQAQWSAVMGTAPWNEIERTGQNRPATFISWNAAKAFCEQLTAKEHSGTYRLPTEAEWEYACRAGTTTHFSFGDDQSQLGQFAWYRDNSKKIGENYAHEVALKKPNPFGLFDMHGNVWEWCDGAYTSDPSKEERPRPASTGGLRVAAGGSWDWEVPLIANGGSALNCHSASRVWYVPTTKAISAGFRVLWIAPASNKPRGPVN